MSARDLGARAAPVACGLVAAALLCGAPRPAAADWPPFGRALVTAPRGPGANAGLSFAPPAPGGAVALRFALPHEARVTLAVYDSAGRRVRALAAGGLLAAGDHALAWDGRDATGRTVQAGVYFARLTADGDALTRKIVAFE